MIIRIILLLQTYKLLLIAGVAVSATVGGVVVFDIVKSNFPSKSYDISVDPLIDKQSLFTTGRITIKNTGSEPLTNVRINFGGGDILELGTMQVGEKVILSPPPENEMKYVMVTADPDIYVNKAYREPPKMVGMMGS